MMAIVRTALPRRVLKGEEALLFLKKSPTQALLAWATLDRYSSRSVFRLYI
jgi:hypothetical protein